MTMRKLLFVLSALLTLASTPPARAQDWSWVMSIPYAMSGDYIYKIRLLEIDGEPQEELLRYAVDAGDRTFTVRMMLDVEWEPDLSASRPRPIAVPYSAGLHDLNGDGRLDAVYHFRVQEAGLACGEVSAALTGVTIDGVRIEGLVQVLAAPRPHQRLQADRGLVLAGQAVDDRAVVVGYLDGAGGEGTTARCRCCCEWCWKRSVGCGRNAAQRS